MESFDQDTPASYSSVAPTPLRELQTVIHPGA